MYLSILIPNLKRIRKTNDSRGLCSVRLHPWAGCFFVFAVKKFACNLIKVRDAVFAQEKICRSLCFAQKSVSLKIAAGAAR